MHNTHVQVEQKRTAWASNSSVYKGKGFRMPIVEPEWIAEFLLLKMPILGWLQSLFLSYSTPPLVSHNCRWHPSLICWKWCQMTSSFGDHFWLVLSRLCITVLWLVWRNLDVNSFDWLTAVLMSGAFQLWRVPALGFPISFIFFHGWGLYVYCLVRSELLHTLQDSHHFSFSTFHSLHVLKYCMLLRSEILWVFR